ncbi:MAG: hypothetical protein JJ855_00315 [Rhodospirillales bacterium]|nr:hypothetical protein [Rhodospirillales bacterium]
MRITDASRFPWPVLQEGTDDYAAGSFTFVPEIAENPEKATLLLRYSLELDEPGIRKLVDDGDAAAGIYVTCQETYFSELMELSLADAVLEFPAGALSGRVVLRPMVWTRRPVSDFPAENCHPEFGDGPLSFPAGAVIAFGPEEIISAGREKLREMETIFSIARAEELEAGTFALDLESDRITVLVADDIYESVNQLRDATFGPAITLNSVFLPAVMQTISSMRDGGGVYEGKRWHHIFSAKCEHLGIDVMNDEPWPSAQKLLEAPYRQIHNCPEFRE